MGALAIVWFLPNTQTIMRDYKPVLGDTISKAGALTRALGRTARPNLATGVALGLVAALLALRQLQGQPGEFIYFQF